MCPSTQVSSGQTQERSWEGTRALGGSPFPNSQGLHIELHSTETFLELYCTCPSLWDLSTGTSAAPC